MTTRSKAIAGLIGLFAVGVALGATGVGLYVRHQISVVEKMRDKEVFQQYFSDKLELSAKQHDSLRAELDKAYDELADLRQSSADKYHSVLDSLASRIGPGLSPHQRELLQAHTKQMHEVVPRSTNGQAKPALAAATTPQAQSAEPATTPPDPAMAVKGASPSVTPADTHKHPVGGIGNAAVEAKSTKPATIDPTTLKSTPERIPTAPSATLDPPKNMPPPVTSNPNADKSVPSGTTDPGVQDARLPPGIRIKIDQKVAEIDREVGGLSSTQRDRIYQTLKKTAIRHIAIRRGGGLPRDKFVMKRDVNKQARATVYELLTPEQRDKLAKELNPDF